MIFAVRPYDIGDRCVVSYIVCLNCVDKSFSIDIDGYGQMNVTAINLMTTEAVAPDGRLFIIPNRFVVYVTCVKHVIDASNAVNCKAKLLLS